MISSPVGFDLVSVIIDTFCVQIFGERSATYAIEAESIRDKIIMIRPIALVINLNSIFHYKSIQKNSVFLCFVPGNQGTEFL